MHWLLLLSILSTTTNLKDNNTGSLNRVAENALRQQIGGVNTVRVDVAPRGKLSLGNFDHFNVTLDGFSADRLMGLANRDTTQRNNRNGDYYPEDNQPAGDYYPNNDQSGGMRYPDDNYPNYGRNPVLKYRGSETNRNRNNFDLGDILQGGDLGDLGGVLNGDLGGVLGDILGKKSGSGGRIGRINLRATNFTFQGTRYDLLTADIGELQFDWSKALRGDFDVKSMQPGNLQLTLRADQAARFIAPRLPSIRDVRLRFDNGRAFIGGRSDMYGLRVPFEVGGRLSVRTNQVFAEDLAVSVARLRLPSVLTNELTRGVNPLYDFDQNQRWPIAVNLNTTNTTGNALSLRGGMQWLGFSRDRENNRDQRNNRNDNNSYPRYPR